MLDGDNVQRGEFFKTTAGAGLAVGLPNLTRPLVGRRVGGDFPQRLRERTARLRRLDDVLGGGDTYRVYLGEYQFTKALIRGASCTEETGLALLSVLAEQAQQAGWAAIDGGMHDDANGLYVESHKAAVDAADAALAGNALAFLAYQKINGDRQAGIQTAAQACQTAGPDASPGGSWLAESYVTAGEVEQAAAVTGRALDLCAGVASVRPRQRLAPVLERLGEYRSARAVADVLEKAGAGA